MTEYVLIATVVLGLVCAMTSTSLCAIFWRREPPIVRAVAFMLGGEAVCMWIVTLFAISALPGHLMHGESFVSSVFSSETATALRWMMFFVTLGTSVHLAVQVKNLMDSECIDLPPTED